MNRDIVQKSLWAEIFHREQETELQGERRMMDRERREHQTQDGHSEEVETSLLHTRDSLRSHSVILDKK